MNASKVLVGGFLLLNVLTFVVGAGVVLLFFPVELSRVVPAAAAAVSGLSTEGFLVFGAFALVVGVSFLVPVVFGVWYVLGGAVE